MGKGYQLVNLDKKETISFHLIDSGVKLRELAGTSISGSIVTFYLLNNIDDRITFINDQDSEYTLFGSKYSDNDFKDFTDVIDSVIEGLIKNEIVKEVGIKWIDREENLFYRDLINIWDPKFEWNK